MKSTQISAPISDTTRSRLERYCRETGIKKGYLIEQALLHHLQALESLPPDAIIQPRLVISRKSGEALLDRLENPREPAEKLRELMKR